MRLSDALARQPSEESERSHTKSCLAEAMTASIQVLTGP